MKAPKITTALSIPFWILLVYFSLLLSHNALLYFTHGGEYGILPEKGLARQDLLWNIAFYIHLPTGIICLLTPIFLFVQRHFKKALMAHQFVGKIYVWITLVFVCPTGMYLALYAKGGTITQVGFMLQGILLMLYTWKGYQKILARDKAMHLQYMIRSYAMATVVLSFRILHITFFIWKVPYQENYAISQWLGLAINLLIAEIIIAFLIQNNLSLKTKSQSYETIV